MLKQKKQKQNKKTKQKLSSANCIQRGSKRKKMEKKEKEKELGHCNTSTWYDSLTLEGISPLTEQPVCQWSVHSVGRIILFLFHNDLSLQGYI